MPALRRRVSDWSRKARSAHRRSDGIDPFNTVMDARFTTHDMIEAEQRLHHAAELLADQELHEVRDSDREAALAHVTDGRDLGIVVGYAGTGKSAMLGVAREAREAAGYEVRGVALSGIAAENLENGSGIASRAITSMEHGWKNGRDMLAARNVLVIDEAGMAGTRQLERVLSRAAEAGAKVVLVGDPRQTGVQDVRSSDDDDQ